MKESDVKVGMKVEIVEENGCGTKKGSILEILRDDHDGTCLLSDDTFYCYDKFEPIEKKSDLSECYKKMQEASGIKVGDKVKVLRKASRFENGWNNSWKMDDAVGNIYAVVKVESDHDIHLSYNDGHFGFPFFVLEKIEDGPRKKNYSDAMNKVAQNIDARIERYYVRIQDLINDLKDANDIDTFMKIKKDIMYEITKMLPIGAVACPFCTESCSNCEYKEKHGGCGSKSNYGKLINAIRNLQVCIENYY
jgi:hypothetical protein